MDGRGRTILVVDDNAEERSIFSSYLAFVGFHTLCAANGAEALAAARAGCPDLILLDLSMPVMDGWETIARLRAEAATAGIPVVAVTAAAVDELSLRRRGFSGYVGKPMAPFELLREVERCLGWKSETAPPRPAPRRALEPKPAPARQQGEVARYQEASGSD
jgi:two-component system, cell cycle response regulator DivK